MEAGESKKSCLHFNSFYLQFSDKNSLVKVVFCIPTRLSQQYILRLTEANRITTSYNVPFHNYDKTDILM